LKNSIRTNWKAKNETYINSVKDVIREIQTPVAAQVEGQPETLVTDAQAAKWHRVVDKIHTAAKAELDLVNDVLGDVDQYSQDTQPARQRLAGEAREWNTEAKQVNQGYKDAIRFDIDNIHYDAPKPGHPGSIDFTNTDQVVQHWRNAIQADQNLGK